MENGESGIRNFGVKQIAYPVLLILFLLFLFSACKSHNDNPVSQSFSIRVYVSDTFDNGSLDNIPVTLECGGIVYDKVTRGGFTRIDLDNPANCTLKVNFSNQAGTQNSEYIPSVIENLTLTGGNDIRIDIVRKSYLNPEGYKWKDLIDAYRGRNKGGVNQVWTKQPSRWIVGDPNHVLDKYPDKYNNPIMDNIMKGFDAIQEYTNGFIIAPPRDKIEIYNGTTPSGNVIAFEITDGRAYEDEDVNSNNEIYNSWAGTSGRSKEGTIMELTSSVQGGDNDSTVGVFNTGKISPLDKTWGEFNYNKREPGSKIVLNGQYGHLYELRVK